MDVLEEDGDKERGEERGGGVHGFEVWEKEEGMRRG